MKQNMNKRCADLLIALCLSQPSRPHCTTRVSEEAVDEGCSGTGPNRGSGQVHALRWSLNVLRCDQALDRGKGPSTPEGRKN